MTEWLVIVLGLVLSGAMAVFWIRALRADAEALHKGKQGDGSLSAPLPKKPEMDVLQLLEARSNQRFSESWLRYELIRSLGDWNTSRAVHSVSAVVGNDVWRELARTEAGERSARTAPSELPDKWEETINSENRSGLHQGKLLPGRRVS